MKNLFLFFLIAFTTFGFAQEQDDCTKYRGLTPIYAKQKMWRDAANFFVKAYNECGTEGLEKADFNNAKIIYKSLIKEESDETRKKELTDTLLWVYEVGNTYEDDPKWKADYAVELTKAKSDDSEKIDSLFQSVHVLKDKGNVNHYQYYFIHLLYNYNDAEDDASKEDARNRAIDEYLILSDYISIQLKDKKAKGNDRMVGYLEKTQSNLDNYFVKLASDCEMLTNVLSKKLTALPTEKTAKAEKLKGYLSLLEKRKCDETDLYGQFADSLLSVEPTAEAYYSQGNFYVKQDKGSKAVEYFKKALELEGEGENAGKYQYGLATAYYSAGSYKAAFSSAKKVSGEYYGKAMIICANSIAKTANSCGDTTFDRKANYWLANDYIRKASGAGEDVSSSLFLSNAPSDDEVFTAGKSKGDSITLSCWGESTTIR